MKNKLLFTTLSLIGIAAVLSLSCCYLETKSLLKPGETVAMPDVKGRIDHMQYDADGQRLFIAAVANGTLEVVDLKKNSDVFSIKHLQSPHGVIFLPQTKKLYVSCGGDGFVHVFDSENFHHLDSVYVGNDADNMRFDSIQQKFFVGSDNGMTIINLGDLKIFKTIELEGHPESFQIDNSLRRMYVNVPDANEIEVINLKNNVVIERWSLMDSKENFPMAVDEKQHRIFVACRHSAKILVMDGQDGNVLSAVGCSGDADDIYYDGNTKQLLVSCGEGYVDVFNEKAQNTFTQTDHVASRILARTSVYVPSEKKFFLAVPSGVLDAAEIRTYTLIP